jgi:uncharacterized membrane protein
MKTARQLLPDVLKGTAVLLMIQVHIMELFATEEVVESFVGKVSLFFGGVPAAPLFMAVMGYFVAKSSRSPKTNLLRGLKLVGLGFLLNVGMNAHLLIKILNGTFSLNPWPYLMGVDILFVAGLSIIVLSLVRLYAGRKLWPYALLALFGVAIHPYLPVYDGGLKWLHYLQAFFWGDAHWSYFPLFPWLLYPTAGFMFFLLNEKYCLNGFSRKGLTYLAVAFFILIAIPLPFAFKISTDLPSYYHHDRLFAFWAIGFLVFWIILFALLTQNNEQLPAFRYLRWVGKNVTVFYVVQWLIIGNTATFIYKSRDGFELFFWFLAVMLFTSILVRTWEVLVKKRHKKLNPDSFF